ncbi:unnamed protein product [Musa textilis]
MSRSKPRSRKDIICYNYGEKGHYKNQQFFATYRFKNFGVIKMGNYGTTDIIGICDIHIKTNLGYKLMFKDVRHVVDLRLNLISVERPDDEDYDSSRWYKSVWHRVLTTSDGNCHSIASFYNPSLKATIALGTNKDDSATALYPKYTFGDYMDVSVRAV